MATQIKVLRKDLIKQISSVKEDNIGIAGIVIERNRLLTALRLQTQPLADVVTINYGTLSWQYDYKLNEDGTIDYEPYVKEPAPCVQLSCDHTVMRFLNCPKMPRHGGEPKIKHLNFTGINHKILELDGIPVDSQALLDALAYVQHSIAVEQGRPVLNCVLLECAKDSITLATADGFRLSVCRIDTHNLPETKLLIQGEDIPALIKFLKGSFTGKGKSKTYLTMFMKIKKDTVKFSTDLDNCELDLFDGKFPDYTQLIPQMGTHIEVVASELLESVKAITTFSRDGSGIIRLEFIKGFPAGNIRLTAHSEDTGDSSADCPANVERDCKIGIDQKYLIEYLRTCKDNVIDLFVTTPSSPMVCHNGSVDKTEVIMPMFTNWN